MLKIHKKECQFYKQVAIHNKCDKSIIMITYLIQINIHFFLSLIQILCKHVWFRSTVFTALRGQD